MLHEGWGVMQTFICNFYATPPPPTHIQTNHVDTCLHPTCLCQRMFALYITMWNPSWFSRCSDININPLPIATSWVGNSDFKLKNFIHQVRKIETEKERLKEREIQKGGSFLEKPWTFHVIQRSWVTVASRRLLSGKVASQGSLHHFKF